MKVIAGLPYEFMRDVRNWYTLRLAIVEVAEAVCSVGLSILRVGAMREAGNAWRA